MGVRRVVGVVACAVAVLASLTATASAKTKVVFAGGPPKWARSLGIAGVDGFLINRVTVHAGDTVVWNGASLANGFHTVDIPKLNGSDLALITATGKVVHGVLDAAGNPFWFDGKVPELAFNTKLFGRTGGFVYNGTSRIDSGLPVGPPHNFAVKFSTPGVYKYYCDVHPGMVGYVVVKPKHAHVPTAAQDASTLRSEERHYVAEARALAHRRIPRNSVSLGVAGRGGLELFAMFPAVLHVKKGTVVRFFMPKSTRETHTATFGPAAYLRPLAKSFESPAPAAQALYPSDPPGHIVLTPTSHGNGFANTGALDRDPDTPLPAAGTIRFAHAGTYHFICLIHPFMRGTIVVK